MTPLLYKCRYCGEGFVALYGLPCTKCTITASAIRAKTQKSLAWAGVINVAIALTVGFSLLAVFMPKWAPWK